MLGLLLLVVGLAGCGSKEINGMKAYKSEITSMKVQSNNLVKIEGTTSAPDGSAMIIADSKNMDYSLLDLKQNLQFLKQKREI